MTWTTVPGGVVDPLAQAQQDGDAEQAVPSTDRSASASGGAGVTVRPGPERSRGLWRPVYAAGGGQPTLPY